MAAATPAQRPERARLTVLYGSQTGNAQDVAERIGREARLLGFAPCVLSMDAYPLHQLPTERFAVFVTSTTGQGETPDNMRRFWRALLRKSLPPSTLAGLAYAVFGLGDSGYVQYNVAAKKLDRRLAVLGGRPLLERGLGDDQHPCGYEAALDPWLRQLWAALQAHCPLPPGIPEPQLDDAALLRLGPLRYTVTLLPHGPACGAAQDGHAEPSATAAAAAAAAVVAPTPGTSAGAAAAQLREQGLQEAAVAAAAAFRAVARAAAGATHAAEEVVQAVGAAGQQPQPLPRHGPWRPFMAPLLQNDRVTLPSHFQDTRHIEFSLEGSDLCYEPGDVLCVFPRTPEADVEAALRRLGLDGNAWVRIEAAVASTADGIETHVPVCEAQLRAIVQGVLDVSGAPPRRYLFQVLCHHTPEGMQRDRLAYFASSEGRDDLYRYCHRERRSLLEVLTDFPDATPPLERLLEAAPLLQPRQFSLASSPKAHPGRAALLVAVVAWTTPTRRARRGLLTNWLAGLQPAAAAAGSGGVPTTVPVWVERGALRLPPDASTPLLLVGPGTGVAPFRSFLWHRAAALCSKAAAQQATMPGGAQEGVVPPLCTQQQQQQCVISASVSPAHSRDHLLFGCRSPQADLYFRAEWGELMKHGSLAPHDGFIAAFSRLAMQPTQQELLDLLADSSSGNDCGGGSSGMLRTAAAPATEEQQGQPGASSRTYVTHKIAEHGAMIWSLLSERGAWVYVAGSAQKMPAGVASALEAVAAEHGGLTSDDATRFVRSLQLTGRYHVEAWS